MPLKLKPPRPGKTPYYYIRGTHLGVRLDESTGFTVEAKARQVLARRKAEIERDAISGRGEPVEDARGLGAGKKTFLSAALAYIEAGGDDRFLGKYDEVSGLWSGPIGHFRERAIEEIDQAALDAAAAKIYPNASAPTRNRQLYTPISAVLKHAGLKVQFRRPKGSRGSQRTTWLKPEQAFALFKAADKRDAELGIFVRFLCYTGCRLKEAITLTCDRLELREGFAYVAMTKNEDPRGVHLPPVVVAALGNHPKGTDRGKEKVFRFRKHGRLYAFVHETFDAAGITLPPRTAFHVLRHTWATWMRRYGGLDQRGLVGTGAWRDEASVRRYMHVVASEESRKANRLPVEKSWNAKKRRAK